MPPTAVATPSAVAPLCLLRRKVLYLTRGQFTHLAKNCPPILLGKPFEATEETLSETDCIETDFLIVKAQWLKLG